MIQLKSFYRMNEQKFIKYQSLIRFINFKLKQ